MKGRRPKKYFWKDSSDKELWGGAGSKSKTCQRCGFLSYKWEGRSGAYTCFDGCYHTTGFDSRSFYLRRFDYEGLS